MSSTTSRRAHAGVVVAAILALTAGTAAASPPEAAAPIIVAVPAPGQTSVWDMPLENGSSADVDVWFTVGGENGGTELPVVLELADPEGRTVFGPVALSSIAGSAKLGELPAGSRTSYRGSVTMPRDVGNEVQGRSQSITFQLSGISTGAAGGSDWFGAGVLPWTGFDLGWLALAALTLVSLGWLITARRKKHATELGTAHEGSTNP